jgi:D-proline reductase (dithiol) PrdB
MATTLRISNAGKRRDVLPGMLNMAEPVEYITRIRENYARLGYKPYTWVDHRASPPPWTPLDKPLSDCRLGLVASGGIYQSGQVAFHWHDDTTFREVPTNVRTSDLRATHFAYDLTDARRDPNVVFPIDTLRRLVAEGFVGELGATALTFMGGIYSARKVADELAPKITARLVAQRVDAALFVPV